MKSAAAKVRPVGFSIRSVPFSRNLVSGLVAADAYTIAARAKARLIVARRNATRVARLDALVEPIGVTRAAMLGVVPNEG